MGKKDRKMIVNHVRNYRKQDEALPGAIIVDIDGTVALMNDRNPFDARKWHEDKPNQPIIDMVDYICIGYKAMTGKELTVLYVTGREGGEENIHKIEQWFLENTGAQPSEYKLFTRTPKDSRGDAIVKLELFEEFIEHEYFVHWVLEDRDTVVKLWRDDLQLPTLQVHWGDF